MRYEDAIRLKRALQGRQQPYSPTAFVEREQRVALMGVSNYEGPGAAMRAFHPYVGRPSALGDTAQPFDLNAPGVVREIKQALVALARLGADPLRNPTDPITETTWKRVSDELSDPYAADAWTGATADEYVTMLSRYPDLRSALDGPFTQLGGSKFGKYGIVGGAQPTAHGLEVLAGAVRQQTGQSLMPLYEAWRGGVFPPPSSVSAPAGNATVMPVTKHGPFWNPFGYTPAHEGGDPELKAAVDDADDLLVKCTTTQMMAQSEAQRAAGLNDCLGGTREGRHHLVLKLNATAPEPSCGEGMVYRRDLARCVLSMDLEPPTVEDCVKAYMEVEGRSREEAVAICRGEEIPEEKPAGLTFLGAQVTTGKAVVAGSLIGLALWAARSENRDKLRRMWRTKR